MTDLEAAQADIDFLLGVLSMLARNIRSEYKSSGVKIIVADAHERLDRLADLCSD